MQRGRLLGGALGADGALALLELGGLLGGGAKKAQAQQHQQGMGFLGKMLDADNDGSMMDDVLKMAMKNMMK